jgi:hypothetical protein
MYLIPYEPENPEQEKNIKRSGAVEANYGDLAEVFAKNYLKSKGFFRNNDLEQMSSAGTQLPLLTYPFLDYLTTVDLSKRSLVELGSGNSTVVFSKLFKNVVSYETNPEWLESTVKNITGSASIELIDRENLETADFDIEDIDILLIDFAGRRTRFIYHYLEKARKKANLIFLDNSDMYRNGAKLLSDAGYVEIPFYGLKSGQTWISCTSIFISKLDSFAVTSRYISNKFTRNDFDNSWDSLAEL